MLLPWGWARPHWVSLSHLLTTCSHQAPGAGGVQVPSLEVLPHQCGPVAGVTSALSALVPLKPPNKGGRRSWGCECGCKGWGRNPGRLLLSSARLTEGSGSCPQPLHGDLQGGLTDFCWLLFALQEGTGYVWEGTGAAGPGLLGSSAPQPAGPTQQNSVPLGSGAQKRLQHSREPRVMGLAAPKGPGCCWKECCSSSVHLWPLSLSGFSSFLLFSGPLH